jgi:thiol:disulfide interchange protein/DsbC/DsbD-like thiol-disulfide interchange protein
VSSVRWLRGHLFSSSRYPRVMQPSSPVQKTFVLLLLAAFLPSAHVFAQRGEPRSYHTHASLVADVRGIVPGSTFTVGLLMKMDPGWHTYWKNPGDAGLATKIEWDLPQRFVAGPLRWPLPHRYMDSGDVLTYGYSKETMLLTSFTAPASLAPGTTVTIRASVTWLECMRECVPGEASLRIVLPVVRGTASRANEDLFASYERKVPLPFKDLKDIALAASARRGGIEITLSVTGNVRFDTSGSGSPDFYTEDAGELIAGRTSVSAAAKFIKLTVPLTAGENVTTPVTVRGVLLFAERAGPLHANVVEVSVPPESLEAVSSGGGGGGSILDRNFEISRTSGETQPLLLYIAFALLGGLLLNIMPCVLPVIALKVFGLVKMAGDRPARIRGLGFSFAAGILASFLALALLVMFLQFAGQQVGWGFQFQEPRFVIVMAAIVFAFGLSLFGVFEITLPSALVTGISDAVAQQRGSGKSYGASFGEGVFATILATPCTAPFLGSALGFAFAQPWWIILLIFTCVAVGMAIPYLVLTSRPAWIRFLPKPGAWMVSAQQLMGFLMMATLLWLLYILGKQMGMEAVIWTGAFLLTVGLACWLVGRYATLNASRRTWWLTWIAAALIVAGGYIFFLVSELDINTVLAMGIRWKQFSLGGLEEDLKGDRPVLLDFTAEWCLTCKVNEKTVLNSHRVIQKLHEMNVLPVRADWTNRNPDITRLLLKFGRSGVPLYVIFPPGRSGTPIVLPEVITPGIVLDALDRAK